MEQEKVKNHYFTISDTHRGSRVLQNMGNFRPGYTVPHHRRQYLYCLISKYVNTRGTSGACYVNVQFLHSCAPFACKHYVLPYFYII